MSLELLKEVYEVTNDREATRELVEGLLKGNYDVSSSNYNWRAIEEDMCEDVMIEELAADPDYLGYWHAWLIADALGLDTDDIQEIQKAGDSACHALGRMVAAKPGAMTSMIRMAHMGGDVFGEHFASYDGCTHEVSYWVQKIGQETGGRAYVNIFRTN